MPDRAPLIPAVNGVRVELQRPRTLPVPLAQIIDQIGRGTVDTATVSGYTPPDTGLPLPTLPTGGGGTPIPGAGGPNGGITHTAVVHMTAVTTGGVAGHEIRVTPQIQNPWTLDQLAIIPGGEISPGQFLDILIATDTDTTDTATPTGTSLWTPVVNANAQPAPDNTPGIQLPAEPITLEALYATQQTGCAIKLHSYYTAPATTLPTFHVVIIWTEYPNGWIPTSLPPITPAPAPPGTPGTPGPTPPPGTPGTPGPTPPPAPTPITGMTYQFDYTAPVAFFVVIHGGTSGIADGTRIAWITSAVPPALLQQFGTAAFNAANIQLPPLLPGNPPTTGQGPTAQ